LSVTSPSLHCEQ